MLSLNPHPSEHALFRDRCRQVSEVVRGPNRAALVSCAKGSVDRYAPGTKQPCEARGAAATAEEPLEAGRACDRRPFQNPLRSAASGAPDNTFCGPQAPSLPHSLQQPREAHPPPGQAWIQQVGSWRPGPECGAVGGPRAAPTGSSLQFQGHRASPSRSPAYRQLPSAQPCAQGSDPVRSQGPRGRLRPLSREFWGSVSPSLVWGGGLTGHWGPCRLTWPPNVADGAWFPVEELRNVLRCGPHVRSGNGRQGKPA